MSEVTRDETTGSRSVDLPFLQRELWGVLGEEELLSLLRTQKVIKEEETLLSIFKTPIQGDDTVYVCTIDKSVSPPTINGHALAATLTYGRQGPCGIREGIFIFNGTTFTLDLLSKQGEYVNKTASKAIGSSAQDTEVPIDYRYSKGELGVPSAVAIPFKVTKHEAGGSLRGPGIGGPVTVPVVDKGDAEAEGFEWV